MGLNEILADGAPQVPVSMVVGAARPVPQTLERELNVLDSRTHLNNYIPEKPLALTFTSVLFGILAYATYRVPETQVDAILFGAVSIAAGVSAVGCWYKKI